MICQHGWALTTSFLLALLFSVVSGAGEARADCDCFGKCGLGAGTLRVDTCTTDASACTADTNAVCTQRGEATTSVLCVEPWTTTGLTPECNATCENGASSSTSAADGSICVAEAIIFCDSEVAAVNSVIWRDFDISEVPAVPGWGLYVLAAGILAVGGVSMLLRLRAAA